jgi:hypothetical protein
MTSTSGRVTRSTKRAASSTDATASTVPKTETKSDSSTSAATGVTKKRKADVLTELDRDAGQDSIVPATKKKRARLSCNKKQEYKHQEIEPIDDLYNGESFYGIILDMEGPCPECLEIADRFTTGLAEDELTAIHYMITREDQSSDAAASKEAKAGAGGTSGAGVFSAGASAATGASSAGAGSSLSSSGSKGFDVPGEEKKLTRGRVCDLVLEVFMLGPWIQGKIPLDQVVEPLAPSNVGPGLWRLDAKLVGRQARSCAAKVALCICLDASH